MDRVREKQAILEEIEDNSYEVNVFCTKTMTAMVDQSTTQARVLWKQYEACISTTANFLPNADDAITVGKIVKELGGASAIGAKVITKRYGGYMHFIIKSKPGLRKALQRKSYFVTRTQALDLTFTRAGALNTIRQGARFGVYVSSIYRVAEFVMTDEHSFTKLFGGLGMDFLKIYAGMHATAVGSSFISGYPFFATAAVGPIFVVAVTGVVVAGTLFYLDTKFGITDKAIELLDRGVKSFEPSFNALSYTIPRELKNLKTQILEVFE
ncbi:MAG: hypothetical protein VX185_12390 [Pseudomonadota bacterium]|nr:hypothetical protein [Pseudomonadota bacterium]